MLASKLINNLYDWNVYRFALTYLSPLTTNHAITLSNYWQYIFYSYILDRTIIQINSLTSRPNMHLYFPDARSQIHFAYFFFFGMLFQAVFTDFFSSTIIDHMIVRGVYTSVQTADWINCLLACQDDVQCSSYNFNLDAETIGGNRCELSRCTMNEKQGEKSLIFQPGFVFHQLKPMKVKMKSISSCFIVEVKIVFRSVFFALFSEVWITNERGSTIREEVWLSFLRF